MQRTRRAGYGLFQLVAVMAVILLLLGLLLPAIQKVREAAARMSSQNNLKQLLLAAHNYESVHNNFPAGVDKQNLSAFVQLLPYIEQDNLFKLADKTKGPDDPANAMVAQVRIKVFISPLDSFGGMVGKTGPTNYQCVAGAKHALADNDGVFFRESATRLGGITDGTSNTVAIVETLQGDGGKQAVSVERQHVRLGKDALKNLKDTAGVQDFKDGKNIVANRGGAWMDGRFLQSTMTATRVFNAPEPDVDCGGEGGLSGPRTLSTVINLGMCDGSVRATRPNLNFDTWKALATRAGGEVLNDF